MSADIKKDAIQLSQQRAGRVPSPQTHAGAALMTAASREALRRELEQLRITSRLEIAQRLRDARAYGGGVNNDEYHAVREEQMVLEARIGLLEETIARAMVVDPPESDRGAAVIGSSVLIEDLDSGAVSQYRLVSAHQPLRPDTVSAASPMGEALLGTTSGTVVAVDLPNGRRRRVRLVDVTTDDTPGSRLGQAA
jgi:transcription elongation factor GreA